MTPDDDANPWDFGILVDQDGRLVPPGACDGYHAETQGRGQEGDGV